MAHRAWMRFPAGGVDIRTDFDVWERPAYAFGIHSAARLARALGLKAISVVEFGVAGGNGLVAMERTAALMAKHFGLEINVYGFDTGSGMPAAVDYRDLPHVWARGFYQMDEAKLRGRLTHARLVLGNVVETVPRFLEQLDGAPLGFISFDLDYYTSTKQALRIFDRDSSTRLPRALCYFDDIIHPQRGYVNPYVGELLAINEYNSEQETKKIARIEHLAWMRQRPAIWNEQMYVHHDFAHPLYTQLIVSVGDGKYHELA